MEVDSFEEIAQEFDARVQANVWCGMATVDRKNRPYSRIMHPIWEGCTGWALTHRDSHKSKHLAVHPFVSLAYVRGDIGRPMYVDCRARWVEDPRERERIWKLAESLPPPVGFDPAQAFESPSSPRFGVLELTPWRIVLVSFPAPSYEAGHRVWRAKPLSV